MQFRIRAQTLLTRMEGFPIHPSRATQWANLTGDITRFLHEYEEYVSWGGWKCFLRKNILKRARDRAEDELDSLEHSEEVRVPNFESLLALPLTSSSLPVL